MDSSAGQSGQYLLGSFLGTILENSSSFEEVGTAFAGIVVLMIILAFIAGIIIAAFLNFVMNSAKMALHHEEKSFPRLAITALISAAAIFFTDPANENFRAAYIVYPSMLRGIVLSLSMAGYISALLSAVFAWTDKKREGKTQSAEASPVRIAPPAQKALPAENVSDAA